MVVMTATSASMWGDGRGRNIAHNANNTIGWRWFDTMAHMEMSELMFEQLTPAVCHSSASQSCINTTNAKNNAMTLFSICLSLDIYRMAQPIQPTMSAAHDTGSLKHMFIPSFIIKMYK
jgi:hypothetical protein